MTKQTVVIGVLSHADSLFWVNGCVNREVLVTFSANSHDVFCELFIKRQDQPRLSEIPGHTLLREESVCD